MRLRLFGSTPLDGCPDRLSAEEHRLIILHLAMRHVQNDPTGWNRALMALASTVDHEHKAATQCVTLERQYDSLTEEDVLCLAFFAALVTERAHVSMAQLMIGTFILHDWCAVELVMMLRRSEENDAKAVQRIGEAVADLPRRSRRALGAIASATWFGLGGGPTELRGLAITAAELLDARGDR